MSDTRESEDKQKSEGENHEMRNRPTLSTKMFFSRKPFASTVLPLLLRLICLAAVLVPCHGQRALFNLGKRVANKSSDTRAGSVRAAATGESTTTTATHSYFPSTMCQRVRQCKLMDCNM